MITTHTNAYPLLLAACLMLSSPQTANGRDTSSPEERIEIDHLPDLNIPRSGHAVFYTGSELVVAGGHTNGFVPTPTAEYYHDGKWHLMQMTYPHDNGFSVVLKSGKVMLGGGHEQPIGIGQTFLVDEYDPATHSFNGFCSLDRKRALASAVELDSGQVVVAGNWYFDDGIELFHDRHDSRADYNGNRLFTFIKELPIARSAPLLIPISHDNALIIGNIDNKDTPLWLATADLLRGDSVHIPFLETWQPINSDVSRMAESAIGDEAKGDYAYLLAVHNRDGQVAIAKVENGAFSLLPTACDIPMQCGGDPILYSSTVIVDRKARRGYLLGVTNDPTKRREKTQRWYILCIDYASDPASLKLCYTDPIPAFHFWSPVLTPEGNLLIAGGIYNNSNFTPSKQVLILRVGATPSEAGNTPNGRLWGAAIITFVLLVAAVLLVWSRRRRCSRSNSLTDDVPPHEATNLPDADESDKLLMIRIREAMESERIFLNSDLKLSDMAELLSTNSRYISRCINTCEGCSFSDFVNVYRINYTKQLLRSQPDIKIGTAGTMAGFSNEQSFFRTFKAHTGMTPKEWMNKSRL